MAFGSWSRPFEIRTKIFALSLDHFIHTKKNIFCIKRPRLVTIFSILNKENFKISLDRFKNTKKNYSCIKRPRLVAIFSDQFSNSRTFENRTFDYGLLKRSVLGWRSVFRVRFSEFGFRAPTVYYYMYTTQIRCTTIQL